jgi:ATP-dependent RNA helicase RhlE
MSFDSLGLEADLLRAVREQGYKLPTPIQLRAIPVILAGRDLMAGAQTGTGKTAGFALPILQILHRRPRAGGKHGVRALVLTPTRELAAQVGESMHTYGRHLGSTSAVVFGGVNIRPQISRLRRGVDILVATPGRLLDLARQGAVDLSGVEILVLDEADRMLDMGFLPDIRRILALLPERSQRQTMLFSATFPPDIKRLAEAYLERPERIEVAGANTTAEGIEQRVHPVDKQRKREVLSHLVGAGDWRQVLVFTRTKHGANRLAQQLVTDGLNAVAIHGNKSQGARTRALADFRGGKVRVLVATDIAARGLDIDRLPHVVNYELPNVPEDYVHRIGRTGRAGQPGRAVSLVSADELAQLGDIERLLGRCIPREVLPDFVPRESLDRAQPALRPARSGVRRGSGQAPPSRTGRARSATGKQRAPRAGGRKQNVSRSGQGTKSGDRKPMADRVFGHRG